MGDLAGEDAQILWDKARAEAEENHKRNNPHLFPHDIPIIPKKDYSLYKSERQPNLRADIIVMLPIEEQIQSCTSKAVLKAVYEKIVKGKPDLQTIYDNKLKQLSNE